jgi:uncharacterized membrane protein YhaH (DUF805 family)
MAAGTDAPGLMWLLYSPSGRIGRQPFAMSILLWLALQGVTVSQMFANQHRDGALALWTLALILVTLASVVSLFMLTIKRLHDIGYPAIGALLLLVPVASFLVLIALLIWPSTPPNAYGRYTNRPE